MTFPTNLNSSNPTPNRPENTDGSNNTGLLSRIRRLFPSGPRLRALRDRVETLWARFKARFTSGRSSMRSNIRTRLTRRPRRGGANNGPITRLIDKSKRFFGKGRGNNGYSYLNDESGEGLGVNWKYEDEHQEEGRELIDLNSKADPQLEGEHNSPIWDPGQYDPAHYSYDYNEPGNTSDTKWSKIKQDATRRSQNLKHSVASGLKSLINDVKSTLHGRKNEYDMQDPDEGTSSGPTTYRQTDKPSSAKSKKSVTIDEGQNKIHYDSDGESGAELETVMDQETRSMNEEEEFDESGFSETQRLFEQQGPIQPKTYTKPEITTYSDPRQGPFSRLKSKLRRSFSKQQEPDYGRKLTSQDKDLRKELKTRLGEQQPAPSTSALKKAINSAGDNVRSAASKIKNKFSRQNKSKQTQEAGPTTVEEGSQSPAKPPRTFASQSNEPAQQPTQPLTTQPQPQEPRPTQPTANAAIHEELTKKFQERKGKE